MRPSEMRCISCSHRGLTMMMIKQVEGWVESKYTDYDISSRSDMCEGDIMDEDMDLCDIDDAKYILRCENSRCGHEHEVADDQDLKDLIEYTKKTDLILKLAGVK